MFEVYIKQSFLMVCLCSGIPLICSSISGIFVAVLQTATQIQEQTISYLAKFFTAALMIALFGEWFASEMVGFLQEMLESITWLGKL